MDGRANIRVDDDLEKGKGSTDGVCLQCQGGGCSEETVHNIIGIGGQTDEEEKFGALFDGANDTSDPCY